MKKFDLNTPLIELRGEEETCRYWTIRNAVEGTQIFGGIGSGKSSGSGQFIALKYLAAGFGGLVLTVKPDEVEVWKDYCQRANRSDDLIIVDPSHNNYFNFLEYESGGKNITENVVQVLKTVIRAGEDKAGGKGDDSFWETALDMLITNVIDLCKLAHGSASIQEMYEIVQFLPRPEMTIDDRPNAFTSAFTAARKNVLQKVEEWEKSFSTDEMDVMQSEYLYEQAMCDAIPEARTLKFIDQFFLQTFLNLSEKTRSIIDFSFSGFLFRLLREPIYNLFCQNASTFTPEDCLQGKIILINLPVKQFNKVGRDCQILFKYIWQRAMEKRNVRENGLPVFLWADEAQHFLHEYDAEYQATARSSRIATVYISQNLPNYHANMSGHKSEHQIKSFLGTLATKIFHANVEVETNKYASELIGDGYFEDVSRNVSMTDKFSASLGKSLKIDRIVRPERFSRLKTGSERNLNMVESIIHVQGDLLADTQNYLKIQFQQEFFINF